MNQQFYQPPQNRFTQQYGMPQKPPILYGRLINDINEVTPNEVPMDGSVSFFPASDYSCIYAKAWNKDGTILTVKFVPDVPAEEVSPDNATKDLSNDILERFKSMDKRFDKIEKMIAKKQPYYKTNTGGNVTYGNESTAAGNESTQK